MKITAFSGSPRKNSNSKAMLAKLLAGAVENGAEYKLYHTDEINITPCKGCLKCNFFKECVIKDDQWHEISDEILSSETLVFATPIYFHHMTSTMKKLVDRMRSYTHVQITADGLIHTPFHTWKKNIVLLTCHGSSSMEDAEPLIELFQYMTEHFGAECRFYNISATRLAMGGQITMDEEKLASLYEKLELSPTLAPADAEENRKILKQCMDLGRSLQSIK